MWHTSNMPQQKDEALVLEKSYLIELHAKFENVAYNGTMQVLHSVS